MSDRSVWPIENEVDNLAEYFGRLAEGRLGHLGSSVKDRPDIILRAAVRTVSLTGISAEQLVSQLRALLAHVEASLISETVLVFERNPGTADPEDLPEASDAMLAALDELDELE